MKGIEFYIKEEFRIDEAKLKELDDKSIIKVLKELGFEKDKDFKVKNNSVYAKNEDKAMEIADEIFDTKYELSYDDEDDFKLNIFG